MKCNLNKILTKLTTNADRIPFSKWTDVLIKLLYAPSSTKNRATDFCFSSDDTVRLFFKHKIDGHIFVDVSDIYLCNVFRTIVRFDSNGDLLITSH